MLNQISISTTLHLAIEFSLISGMPLRDNVTVSDHYLTNEIKLNIKFELRNI